MLMGYPLQAEQDAGAFDTPLLLRSGDLLGSDLGIQRWRERARSEVRTRSNAPAPWRVDRAAAAHLPRLSRPSRVLALRACWWGSRNGGVWAGSSARDRRKARRHGWDACQLLAETRQSRCDYPTNMFLEIDHIIPLAEGGRTELTNTWRICSHHHHLKTYFGWRVIDTPEGRDLVPP
jgi:hypothetical protein